MSIVRYYDLEGKLILERETTNKFALEEENPICVDIVLSSKGIGDSCFLNYVLSNAKYKVRLVTHNPEIFKDLDNVTIIESEKVKAPVTIAETPQTFNSNKIETYAKLLKIALGKKQGILEFDEQVDTEIPYKNYILIAPFCKSIDGKVWDLENFIKLGQFIENKLKIKVIMVGHYELRLPFKYYSNLPIRNLIALIHNSSLTISLDSGIIYVVGLLKKRGLIVTSEKHHKGYDKYFKSLKIVSSVDISSISIDRVFKEIEKELKG